MATQKYPSVEEFLAQAQKLPEADVEVPELGLTVRIRAFRKGQQTEINNAARIEGRIDPNLLDLHMFVAGVIEPQFTADHVGQLRESYGAAVDRVVREITKLNRASVEDVQAAEKRFRDGA